MYYLYQELIFKPLYNGLVGIMNTIPWIDVGIAVIIFTVIVKLVLFPLSKASLLTQVRMKEIEPEANKIKAQYASDRQTQALKIMELYKEKKVKPFSGILLLFIQLPILFALISVFYKIIPTVNPEFLYSFVSAPDVSGRFLFLGLIDLTQKSLALSVITAVLQYLQLKYSLVSKPQPKIEGVKDFATELSASMNKQMKFVLPVIAFVSTYWFIPATFPQAASIIAIYWSVSTLFTLGQELFIRRQYANKLAKLNIK